MNQLPAYQQLQQLQHPTGAMPQQFTVPAQTESIVHVSSENEMLNYPIAPGNTVYFLNDAAGAMYRREVNVYGTQTLPEIFDIKKRTQASAPSNGDYITRKEVEDMILDLMVSKENKNADAK